MMCERAPSRESHGAVIAEHQVVQEKIAESYAMIRMLRLFVLETAWKIDQTSTQEARTDIAAVKFTMARVLRDYAPHDGYFPTEFIPHKRKAAWEKMQPVLDARPDLAAAAQAYQQYLAKRA